MGCKVFLILNLVTGQRNNKQFEDSRRWHSQGPPISQATLKKPVTQIFLRFLEAGTQATCPEHFGATLSDLRGAFQISDHQNPTTVPRGELLRSGLQSFTSSDDWLEPIDFSVFEI